MTLEVQQISIDDWPAWRAIRLRALREAPAAFGSRLADVEDREAIWRGRIDAAEACFLAFIDGAVKGMVAADPTAHGIALQSMFVAEEARGCGVSDRLVEAVVAAAAGRDLVLGVMRENRSAIRAYERTGFVHDGGVTDVDCDVTMRFVPQSLHSDQTKESDHAR